MSHSHRSVPPLAAITLPSPPQQHSPTNLGQLPPSWQQSEEMMRIWYQAKMEEDRREQERERTRQEHQRMETRRIELDMLREALNNGVPPTMVPLIFVGTGALTTSSEWMQQYIAQNIPVPHASQGLPGQRQIRQAPTDASTQHTLRRETRSIQGMGQSSNSGPQQITAPSGPTQQSYVSTYQLPGTGNLGGTQGRRASGQSVPPPPPPRTSLPRINTTNELQFQQVQPQMSHNIVQMAPPVAQSGRGSSQSHAPHQTEQSPSIFFHHWVPPGTQSGGSGSGGGKESGSGSGGGGGGADGSPPQRQLDSPFSHQPPSNPVTSSDFSNSPKKRKSTAAQGQQPPPPTSQPFSPQSQTTSTPAITPSRSTRRAHARHRSIETAPRGFESQRLTRQVHRRSVGAGDAPEGMSHKPGPHPQPQPPYQPPPTPGAAEDHPRGNETGVNTTSHYHHPPPPPSEELLQQRQQSAPPPQHPPPPPRPFSAGSEFRNRGLPFAPPSNPIHSHPISDSRDEDNRDSK